MRPQLVLPSGAGRDEWLEARRHGVTASEIAVILGLSPHEDESARSLYHRKRGEIPDDDEDNDAQRWGRRLEAPIADEFADRHPEFGVEYGGLYASESRPWQMATPDRLLFDTQLPELTHAEPVSVLEIKTSGSFDDWGDKDTDEIPDHYRCQVLWQMDVFELNEARVALLVSGRSYREYTVAYDKDDVTLLREAARDFLDSVDLGKPPDVDAAKATTEALKHLHPDLDDTEVEIPVDVGDEYTAACASYKTAKENKKLAENRLREIAGRGRYVMSGGCKIATRSVYEVAEHHRKASKVDKFIPARRK